MLIKKLIEKIDSSLRWWIGEKTIERVESVKNENGAVKIAVTDCIRRFKVEKDIDNISEDIDFKNLKTATKQKLGVAIGKVLGKDLVVEFTEKSQNE